MADITISDLPLKTELLDSDMVVVDSGAQSHRMYYAQFKSLFLQAFREYFVDAAGDTMTGMLTISKANDHIRAQDTVLDVNTTPSSGLNGGYYSITDKNNNLITRLYSSNTTDGYNVSALQVWSGISANTAASIGIRMKQDGTSAFAFCPTPASNANANHIATTAWVRSYAPYITQTYINGTSWYRVWSNGWCEQGGRVDRSTTGTVSLLRAMANTSYSLCMFSPQDHRYAWGTALSTTSFTFSSADDNTVNNDGVFCWEVKGYIAN